MAENTWKQVGDDLARATRIAWQTALDTTVAAQEWNVKFLQSAAQTVAESSLQRARTQSDASHAVLETIARHAERQHAAVRTLAQESVEAAIALLYAPLAFYRSTPEATQS